MEFIDIVKQRYATKKFDGRKITDERLNKLLEMIRLAPSSFGLQPFKVKVIADQETKERLMPASWNQQQINTCSHLLVFCADTNIKRHIDEYEKMMKAAGISDEISGPYIGMMRSFESSLSTEAKLSWAQRQAYIAVGNAVNGAKSLSLDSCPMEGFDPKQYSELLGLPEHLVPTALVAVGHAADKPNPKIRFPAEELFI